MQRALVDLFDRQNIYSQLAKIMQFNRSEIPYEGYREDTRKDGKVSDAEQIDLTAGAGFSLDLLEPRPLAPPESRYLVTDPIEISMLQMGFHHSTKDEKANKRISRAPLQGSGFACARSHNLKSLQSSDTGTATIYHHDIALQAPRLPQCHWNKKCHNRTAHAATQENSSPCHVADIQNYHLPLESMPFDEWSRDSQASIRDRRRFKESGSFSSSASSSCGIPPGKARTVDYQTQSDEHWMEKYQELQDFFRSHDHSNVPSIFPQNQALANWVKRTRSQYKLFHQQTSHNQHTGSTLTKERVELLNRLDFQTNLRAVSWQQQYDKLVAFHETHGHIRVTVRDDPSLCTWIKRQRKHYRDFCVNGGEGFMTAERIQKLLAVDPAFVVNKVPYSGR